MAQNGSTKPFRVAIIGGGIAGLSLAKGLLEQVRENKANIDVQIYEQAPKFGEIGAGVAFGPNALKTLTLLGLEAELKILGQCPKETEDIWFEYRYAMADHGAPGELITTVTGKGAGKGNVHRADFLNHLIKVIPPTNCNFDHHLSNFEEREDGVELRFSNGKTVQADLVLACDGIKSPTRKCLYSKLGLGDSAPKEKYSEWIAWRGLVPVDKFNAKMSIPGTVPIMWCGLNRHILTFPVKGGEVVNIVGFVRDPQHEKINGQTAPWAEPRPLSEMLVDFETFLPEIKDMLQCIENPSIWGIFDLPPLDIVSGGRIILTGDAAHATTPHQGSGAGQAIEDALFLSRAITHPTVYQSTSPKNLEAAIAVYNSYRKERAAKVQITSAQAGLLYEGQGVGGEGHDREKMKQNLDNRMKWIWDYDIEGNLEKMCQDLARLPK